MLYILFRLISNKRKITFFGSKIKMIFVSNSQKAKPLPMGTLTTVQVAE